jgi:hypothetical protein
LKPSLIPFLRALSNNKKSRICIERNTQLLEEQKRRERMPTSAAAFERRAEELKAVLHKIFDRLPKKWHEHRAFA